jgi:hypothetical protein
MVNNAFTDNLLASLNTPNGFKQRISSGHVRSPALHSLYFRSHHLANITSNPHLDTPWPGEAYDWPGGAYDDGIDNSMLFYFSGREMQSARPLKAATPAPPGPVGGFMPLESKKGM